MTIHELQGEQLAETWRDRVVKRMEAKDASSEEIEESAFIIYNLSKAVVESLKSEPTIQLPGRAETLILDREEGEFILELFVRSILNMTNQLREVQATVEMDWDSRKNVLEQAAWEVLILSKIVFASSKLPGKAQILLKSEEDMFLIMRKSTDEILKRHLPKGASLRKKAEMTLAGGTSLTKFEMASRTAVALYKSFQDQLGLSSDGGKK